MDLNNIPFHPKQYLKLEEPLKLFINNAVSQDQFDELQESLTKRKTPLVISGKRVGEGKKIWLYRLQMPAYSLKIAETEYRNLNGSEFSAGHNGRNSQYNHRYMQMFLLEAAKGIYLIYQKQSWFILNGTCTQTPEDEHIEWGMEHYEHLLRKMHDYFDGEDEYVRSPRVSDEMDDNVMIPFDQYTQKEHEYETRQVDFTQGILYTSREVGLAANGKKSTFLFTSNDENADPERCTLSVGCQVVVYRRDESSTGLVGVLVEMDSESRDGVLFTLEFYEQFDLERLPETGYLFVHQNDTQRKIRRAVSKSIRSGRTPAKYMYRTFRDFSVEGYEDGKSLRDLQTGTQSKDTPLYRSLNRFLRKRMGSQYPPNKMQLEAIVKGILTKDTLLVLGPPGTGKTTVILSWVEFFLSQGKRVLISSQNNSAVDNVLERFKGKGEIVRLGREEKVQESCKEFLPENRIELMRTSSRSNSQRLERQLTEETKQIDTYTAALEHFCKQVIELDRLEWRLSESCRNLKKLIQDIKQSYGLIQQARGTLDQCRSQSERYQIFLEQSKKRNLLVRIFQAGLRRRAKRKIQQWKQTIEESAVQLAQQEREYHQKIHAMEDVIRQLRGERVLQEAVRLRQRTQMLNQSIFFGDEKNPPLVPVFQSELSTLEILRSKVSFSAVPYQNLDIARQQMDVMKQVRVSAEKILDASRRWVGAVLREERNDIFEEILRDASQVVGATCIGINSSKLFKDVSFDVTIIDESGQIQLHNALVPMSRSPKTLMLGDYKQIPPIVNEEIAGICRLEGIPTHLFEQSFFEFLFEKMRQNEISRLLKRPGELLEAEQEMPSDPDQVRRLAQQRLLKPVADNYIEKPLETETVGKDGKAETVYSCRYGADEVDTMIARIVKDPKKIVNLNSQFRMPGNISDVISEWFYESNYFSSYNMKNFVPVVPGTTLPMVVINTAGLPNRFESQPESKMGYQNLAEAELVADILEAVLRSKSEKKQLEYREELGKRLGIISAYGAQVRCIRQALRSQLGFSDTQAATAVASLDSFQGQERDLIIYSLTRSDKKPAKAARVGFLKELRRLNVAFTRCKKQLVIIGDLDYLQTCMYVERDADISHLPCADTPDNEITDVQVNQCAECKLDCERRFSRFFRLLMQHVQADPPAGDLVNAEELKLLLNGGGGDDPQA